MGSETFFHNGWILQRVNNKNLALTHLCLKSPVKFDFLTLGPVFRNSSLNMHSYTYMKSIWLISTKDGICYWMWKSRLWLYLVKVYHMAFYFYYSLFIITFFFFLFCCIVTFCAFLYVVAKVAAVSSDVIQNEYCATLSTEWGVMIFWARVGSD